MTGAAGRDYIFWWVVAGLGHREILAARPGSNRAMLSGRPEMEATEACCAFSLS
jgi:hypothetical protein